MKFGRAVGVSDSPTDHVSAVSGARWGLPPLTCPQLPGHCTIVFVPPTEAPNPLPYSAAVTPVCSQAVRPAVARVAPLLVGAHGSWPTTADCP